VATYLEILIVLGFKLAILFEDLISGACFSMACAMRFLWMDLSSKSCGRFCCFIY
jgi:hypothetical protein